MVQHNFNQNSFVVVTSDACQQASAGEFKKKKAARRTVEKRLAYESRFVNSREQISEIKYRRERCSRVVRGSEAGLYDQGCDRPVDY